MEPNMNYREQNFKNKFVNAAHHLNVRPEQIISLKLRENVGSHQAYQDLVDLLERDAGLRSIKISADLQGRGYLLSNTETKIIIVEHETGLELLYIAGSIASLIGLVPLVLQSWRSLRGRFAGRHVQRDTMVEIRRLDSLGHLQEERLHSEDSYLSMGMLTPSLATTARLIENEIKILNQQVLSLALRVDSVEKQVSHRVEPIKSRASKTAEKRLEKSKPKKPHKRTRRSR